MTFEIGRWIMDENDMSQVYMCLRCGSTVRHSILITYTPDLTCTHVEKGETIIYPMKAINMKKIREEYGDSR